MGCNAKRERERELGSMQTILFLGNPLFALTVDIFLFGLLNTVLSTIHTVILLFLPYTIVKLDLQFEYVLLHFCTYTVKLRVLGEMQEAW